MPKTIMRSLTIKELSGVDRPAQIGARALILKRDSSNPDDDGEAQEFSADQVADLLKRGKAVLLLAHDGHSHLAFLESYDGEEVVSGETTWQDGHDHPWIMQEGNMIIVGESNKHTHGVDAFSKNFSAAGLGDTTMTPEEQAAQDALKAENDALTAKNERIAKVLALTAVAKVHFDTLTDETEQDTFLAKSADDQATEVEAIAKAKTDADPVVYTTTAGVELRKSHDPVMIELAKQNDLQAKENAALKKSLQDQDLRKRAESDLEFVSGSVETRMALLKAADDEPDEAKSKLMHEALKSNNTAMKAAFETHGANNGQIIKDGSPEDELDKLAKKIHEENPKITFEQAYDKATQSPEGSALYTKMVN